MVAVALHVASRAPELYGPSSRAARAAEGKQRGKERALKVEEARAASAHSLATDSKGVRCALCHTRPSAEIRLQAWLATPCSKTPQGIDPSHMLQLCKGIFWCQVCGATGTGAWKYWTAKQPSLLLRNYLMPFLCSQLDTHSGQMFHSPPMTLILPAGLE